MPYHSVPVLTLESPPRRAYSPPRERNYRPPARSRSPPRREERIETYAMDSWRRRSPSPPRPAAYDAGMKSGRESVASSRRSSPPVHPSRLALVPEERPPVEHFSPRPRSPYRARSIERERSPPPPPRREPPVPIREREPFPNGSPITPAPTPPTGPRNGDATFARAPPTGPAATTNRNFAYPAMSPPLGPASSIPMSAHTRAGNPILSAPSRPRGGGRGGFGGGLARDFQPYDSAGAPPLGPRRGSGAWGPRGGGPGPVGYGGPPSGPRGGPPPFRGSTNSTSTTYPRTQRFNNPIPPTGPAAAAAATAASPGGPAIPTGPAGMASLKVTNSVVAAHLADLPTIVPGGIRQKDLVDTSRLLKLEDESRKLREVIAEREAVGRRGKRDWERLERDGDTISLRAELADEHLRSLNGEGELGGAAF